MRQNLQILEELIINKKYSNTNWKGMAVSVGEPILLIDPSQNYRPDYKDVEEYRIYNNNQVCGVSVKIGI